MNYNWVKDLYNDFGHVFFEKNMSINFFGIRANTSKPNSFDDLLGLCFLDKNGNKCLYTYQATTDPGITVLGDKFGGKNGTLILPNGQYLSLFKKGYHKGEYLALVQARPVEVIRDYNKDKLLTFDSDLREKGMFGLNTHHANDDWNSIQVNNWSWGCQVIRKIVDWDEFLSIVLESMLIFGDIISYTLFNERDIGNLTLDSYF